MLLEFSVANYRSINEKCTFSMLATSISDKPIENIFEVGRNKLLKSAVIYGANSSGKSNVIRALLQMNRIIVKSVRLNPEDKLSYEPFLLSTQQGKPSHFEITIIQSGYKYRYGFELTSEEITEEWLFRSTIKGTSEKALFYRNGEDIQFEEKLFPEGVGKPDMMNKNRLFISLCAQLKGYESTQVVSWFNINMNVLSGIQTDSYYNYSAKMLMQELEGCDKAKSFFQRLKLGFQDIECIENEINTSNLPEDLPLEVKKDIAQKLSGKKTFEMFAIHNIYDTNGNIVDKTSFDINIAESEGTKKLIQLSGPIFDTLNNGKILLIDELDAKMHPHISHHIVDLFNSPKTNPNGAQLIFTTHDTHLLSSNLFRRDQIWFTEKDDKEQTDLYNIMDIRLPDGKSKPRNDANLEKNYIAGRYGAVPYIIND